MSEIKHNFPMADLLEAANDDAIKLGSEIKDAHLIEEFAGKFEININSLRETLSLLEEGISICEYVSEYVVNSNFNLEVEIHIYDSSKDLSKLYLNDFHLLFSDAEFQRKVNATLPCLQIWDWKFFKTHLNDFYWSDEKMDFITHSIGEIISFLNKNLYVSFKFFKREIICSTTINKVIIYDKKGNETVVEMDE